MDHRITKTVHDPIEDERKTYNQKDFIEVACNELQDWVKNNPMPTHQTNWVEWWKQFHNYMSW